VLFVLGDDVLNGRLHAAAARAVGADRVTLAWCSASGRRDEQAWPLHEHPARRGTAPPPALDDRDRPGPVPDAPLTLDPDVAARGGQGRWLPLLAALVAQRLPAVAAYAAGLAADLDRERPAVLVLPPGDDAEARVAAALASARRIPTELPARPEG
jgi:hypothetical protein